MLQKLKTLLISDRHIALVDLTANYTENELLIPKLLEAKVPLSRLAAFSGWNTLSNSLGTALSQATLFTGQLHRLPQSEHPSLYAQNLNFTVERLLDDYAYQKLMHAQLTTLLKLKAISQLIWEKTSFLQKRLFVAFYSGKRFSFYMETLAVHLFIAITTAIII